MSALTKALSDRDASVSVQAAVALGAIGPESAPAIPKLADILRDAGYFQAGIVGPALASIGPAAIPTLIDLATSGPEPARYEAVRGLGRLGPVAIAATPCLTALIDNPNAAIRLDVAFSLWKIRRDPSMIARVASGLEDAREIVRMRAAEDLGEIGLESAPFVPALIRALGDTDDAVRNHAAEAIGRIGPPALQAIPPLMRAVSSRRPAFTYVASRAAAKLGPLAVPALIEALELVDPEARLAASEALGIIGGQAGEAVNALRRLLRSDDLENRLSAASALWRITRDPSLLGTAIEAAKDGVIVARAGASWIPRGRALDLLAEMGPVAAGAVPTLIPWLQGGDEFLRSEAADVLGKIGPGAAMAVPALEAAIARSSPSVPGKSRPRIAAALAVWRISHARSALRVMSGDLRSDDPLIFQAACDGIGEVGPDAADAVSILADRLRSDPELRFACIHTLGKIGPAAKKALPTLLEAFDDEASLHRKAISAAIKAIDPTVVTGHR